jgi:hypothetical protein
VLDEVENESIVLGSLELGPFFELIDEDVEERDVYVVDEVQRLRAGIILGF